MKTIDPPFEYRSATCDVWQVAHLCNHMAGYGWEPITVAEAHYSDAHGGPAQVRKDVADENSELYHALKLMLVLFRRPSGYGTEDE